MEKPKKRLKAGLLISPALITVFLVTIFPICYSLFVSLTDYSLTAQQPLNFIGLSNYVEAFNDPYLWNGLGNTLEIALLALLCELILGFVLALVLNRSFFGRGVAIALLVTPIMIAPAASSLAWRLLFDPRYGPINYFIEMLAGKKVTIDWLGSVKFAIRSVSIVDIWQNTPFVTLFLLAGLSIISPEMYEAARIDGANWIKSLRYITLPLIRPVLFSVMLFRVIDLTKMFDICYSLTKGGPALSTETISYFTYKEGLMFMRVGYGASISFIILAVVAALTTLFIRISMREGTY